MRKAKRLWSALLAVALLFGIFAGSMAIPASAAGGKTNVNKFQFSATELKPGDEFTVTFGTAAMKVQVFTLAMDFDKSLFEVVKVNTSSPYLQYEGLVYDEELEEEVPGKINFYCTAVSTVAEMNASGHMGMSFVHTEDRDYLAKATLIRITFKVKEGASGTTTMSFYESSAGTDQCLHTKENPSGTQNLTIKGNEPAHECTPGAVSYEKGTNGKHTKIVACADNCGLNYSETEEFCSGGAADCEHAATCAYCGNTYGEAKGHGKTNGFRYDHNDGTDTHDVICNDCQKTVEENVACTFEDGSHVCKFACGNETDCTDTNNDHKCDVCGAELSKCADNNKDHKCDVCGTELSKCSDKTGDKDHKCDVCDKDNITQCAGGTATCLNRAVCSECGKEYGDIDPENHVGNREIKYIDNGDDHIKIVFYPECEHEISSTNEPHNYGEDFICDNCGHELAGWVEKDGNWYYVDDEGKAATGAARVPYPTVAINGKTYGPNAEDVAYAKNNASSKYTDAETAVFVFDEKGVFQSDFTGLVGGNRYAVNGVIAWHVGLVEINGEYYYFAGDVNGGGNIMATGKVYASRNTTGFEIVAGGIYYFGEDGKMCQYEGIVEIDGEKFYFEDNRLMIGAGLTELDGQYIYVRSNGQLATGKYWVAKTNGICSVGMYTFDENGFMQTAKDPTVNGLVDGIYYKDGMPYYAGLIEIDGDIYYINSAGEAVTGIYYITKVDNYTGEMEFNRGDKLNFGVDGKLILE